MTAMITARMSRISLPDGRRDEPVQLVVPASLGIEPRRVRVDVGDEPDVAVPNERWGERPCACVVRRAGSELDDSALREFLADRVARWWLPDQVEFIQEVPKTSVGKFDKKVLRAQLAEGSLPRAD